MSFLYTLATYFNDLFFDFEQVNTNCVSCNILNRLNKLFAVIHLLFSINNSFVNNDDIIFLNFSQTWTVNEEGLSRYVLKNT